jgi:hypothetical protein
MIAWNASSPTEDWKPLLANFRAPAKSERANAASWDVIVSSIPEDAASSQARGVFGTIGVSDARAGVSVGADTGADADEQAVTAANTTAIMTRRIRSG